MLRVQLDLQDLSLIMSNISRSQINAMQASHERHQQITSMLIDGHQRFEQHLQHIEHKLQHQLPSLDLEQNLKSGDFAIHDTSRRYKKPIPEMMPGNNWRSIPMSSERLEGIRIHARDYHRVDCHAWCRCVCHAERNLATSGRFGHVLGRLFMGYTGLPFINKSCDSASCRRKETASVSVEYWFPLWFLHHIVRLNMAFPSAAGLQLQLRTLRRVPDSAECIRFAMTGNIDGMRALFVKGLASPQDVSITRGYSITRVSSP